MKYYCTKQVLTMVSIAVINTMTAKNSEKKCLSCLQHSIRERNHGRKLKAGADTEALKESYFLVPFHGLLSLFFTTSRGVAALTVKWIFPHQLSLWIKKIQPRLSHRSFSWRNFNCGSIFQSDSSSWWVDIKSKQYKIYIAFSIGLDLCTEVWVSSYI